MRGAAIIWMAAAVLSAGCANYTTPIVPAGPTTPAERSFETLWGGAQKVLREHYFELDRHDRRTGTITTTPLLARQPLEFWRRDAATAYDVVEGALHSIYRVALVSIRQAGTDAYTVDVRVNVYRSNRRSRRLDLRRRTLRRWHLGRPLDRDEQEEELQATEEGFPSVGDKPPAARRERATGPDDPVVRGMPSWLTALGRDRKLELRLRDAIVAEAAQRLR